MGVRFYFIVLIFGMPGLLMAQSSSNYIDSLKHVIENTDDNDKIAMSYYHLSEHYQKINLDTAFSYAIKMDFYAQKSNSQYIKYKNYFTLGNIYSDYGNHVYGIDNFLKALNVLESKESSNSRIFENKKMEYITILNNMGISYFRKGDYDKAKTCLKQSLKLINNTSDQDSILILKPDKVKLLNNIGTVYMAHKEWDMAMEYLFNALELADEHYLALPSIYNNIGICYFEKNINDKTFHYYTLAKECAEKHGDDYFCVSIYNNIARYYLRKNNLLKAEEFLVKSKGLEKKIKRPYSRSLNTQFFAKLNYKKGNFQKAFDLYEQYKLINDSLVNLESSTKVAQIEKEYELEKEKQAFLLSQEKLKEAQKRKVLVNIIISIVLLSAFLILLLFYSLQKTKMKKVTLERSHFQLKNEKLEQDLVFKNKELATNVMYLVRKNELLNNISDRLLFLKTDLKKSNQDPLQRIIYEVQDSIDNDIWKEFELRFKEVHEDFYQKLIEQFPDLTQNEKKLCAFLRLNMSTKDISTITFQSPHSIRIARTRLRKKLNLTYSDQNLVEFLEGI